MIPPVCHQDDVLNTTIPGRAFVRISRSNSRNQPPGLYWCHPHPHGHSEEQVLGGASGALIIEGIERYNREVAGCQSDSRDPRQVRLNAKSAHTSKPPSRDLSVNFVPVPYPNYPAAIIKTKPLKREFWRVLNASADTLIDLYLLTNGKWQTLGLAR